jgi:hypothetical protein
MMMGIGGELEDWKGRKEGGREMGAAGVWGRATKG